jgi:hypothetical protein
MLDRSHRRSLPEPLINPAAQKQKATIIASRELILINREKPLPIVPSHVTPHCSCSGSSASTCCWEVDLDHICRRAATVKSPSIFHKLRTPCSKLYQFMSDLQEPGPVVPAAASPGWACPMPSSLVSLAKKEDVVEEPGLEFHFKQESTMYSCHQAGSPTLLTSLTRPVRPGACS